MAFATVEGTAPGVALRGGRLRYLQLWDAYGALLTDTQRELCELYYLCDLSLSEIAEEKGISKQAVSDALKKSRELLDFYESKLHVSENNRVYSLAVSEMMTKVKRALASLKEEVPSLAEKIDGIADMVCVGEVISPDEEE